MSWVCRESRYTFLQKCCMRILKCGPIPKHVGFIMDGNRRYANQNNLQCSDGHMQGFLKLSEALRWCKDFGVEELSVYAFSIENFKRQDSEVSFLFHLASEKLQELLDKRDELNENGICVRIIGNLSMLPTDIQSLANKLIVITRFNTTATLNIYMAYTGRDELSNALERIRNGVLDEAIYPSDIDSRLLSRCLYSRLSRPLDLLIRTSGEVRLSDFLVWSCAFNGTVHKFVDDYWPAFSFWDFAQAILYYQLSRTYLSQIEPHGFGPAQLIPYVNEPNFDDADKISRVERFIDWLDRSYWKTMGAISCYSGDIKLRLDCRTAQRCLGESVHG